MPEAEILASLPLRRQPDHLCSFKLRLELLADTWVEADVCDQLFEEARRVTTYGEKRPGRRPVEGHVSECHGGSVPYLSSQRRRRDSTVGTVVREKN